jgi:histone-lysine N-methyltransferase SETD3
MLNHRKPKDEIGCSSSSATSFSDTKWQFSDELNGFIITTIRPIQRGEQIFDSYGRKCNSRFFVNYGFSLDSNEDDNEAVMRFSLSPKDPLYSMKVRLSGGRTSFQNREFQVPATYRETSDREKKTKEMFSFLRFIHAEDSELMVLGSAGQDGEYRIRLDDIDPISIANETRVLKHIEVGAKEALAAFETTLEEDNQLIDNGIEDSNVRNCILQRRGEKQVLHWYLTLCEQALKLLAMPWKDVKRTTAKCYQSRDNIDFYVVSCIVPLVKKS